MVCRDQAAALLLRKNIGEKRCDASLRIWLAGVSPQYRNRGLKQCMTGTNSPRHALVLSINSNDGTGQCTAESGAFRRIHRDATKEHAAPAQGNRDIDQRIHHHGVARRACGIEAAWFANHAGDHRSWSPANRLFIMLVICDSCDLSQESHITDGFTWLPQSQDGFFGQRWRASPSGYDSGALWCKVRQS